MTAPSGFVDPALAHWGLREAPFRLDPDPRFVFEREDHREGLARVLFGVTQMGGVVLVTGEIGCGKTMLAATIVRMLDGRGYRVARVSNPPRTGAALLAGLLEALGAEETGRTAARRAAAIRWTMGAAAERGERIVLAVDEAQRLDRRALDELRQHTTDDQAIVGGVSTMAEAFDAVEVVRQVLHTLEQQFVVVSLVRDIVDRGMSVAIGVEHGVEPLSACSVVVAPVVVDGEHLGSVGVLGPTRMNYPQALATVDIVSDSLGRRLGEG